MKHFANTDGLKIGNKWFKRGDEIPEKFKARLDPLVKKGDVTQVKSKKEPVVFTDSVKVSTTKRNGKK